MAEPKKNKDGLIPGQLVTPQELQKVKRDKLLKSKKG